ncbi:MAG: hypothetical protein IBX64_13745 [Actinobacteria bacterium]|nr:hypothetical protein [Actinomycetota bacterium]
MTLNVTADKAGVRESREFTARKGRMVNLEENISSIGPGSGSAPEKRNAEKWLFDARLRLSIVIGATGMIGAGTFESATLTDQMAQLEHDIAHHNSEAPADYQYRDNHEIHEAKKNLLRALRLHRSFFE